MVKDFREVLRYLEKLNAQTLTKEELAKDPQPVYEFLRCVTDPAHMEEVIRRCARSGNWIIPYNLAAAVSYNESTFSTSLLFLLLSLSDEALGPDLILAYLNAIRFHLKKNLEEAKQYRGVILQIVKRSFEYHGPANELVHSQIFDFFFSVIRDQIAVELV